MLRPYFEHPEELTSPQSDLLNDVVWSRMSKFWTSVMDPTDREALSAVYESTAEVLDTEYVRLQEIDAAKSILDCPVLTQRRWLRFDLNLYEPMKQFLRYLYTGDINGVRPCFSSDASAGAAASSFLSCSSAPSHAAHWHISFPYTIPTGTPATARLVQLQYPILLPLVEIFRMVEDAEGRQVGVRMIPGIDYTVGGDGTSIVLSEGDAGDRYDFTVGFNFTDATNLLPRTFLASAPFPGPDTISVPVTMSNGLPMHALVVRNSEPAIAGQIQQTNSDGISASFQFIPYTGDAATGVAHNSSGILTLPPGTNLSPSDAVFVFGLENAPDSVFNTIHAHEDLTFFAAEYESSAPPGAPVVLAAAPLSSFALPLGVIIAGLSGSVNYLGQQVDVYVDGLKLARTEYVYELGSNTLTFRVPLSYTEAQYRRIDIRFTREFIADPGQTQELHQHLECLQFSATPEVSFAPFDDSGDLDCDPDEISGVPCGIGASGVFDSLGQFSSVFLPTAEIDVETIAVYLNGVFLRRGVEYVVAVEPATGNTPGRTRLTFSVPIAGAQIYVSYRRRGAIYVYGIDDVGICPGLPSALFSDIAVAVAAFQSLYGQPINARVLVDAARILSAGGNPILALFHDERPEYENLPIDLQGAELTGAEARELESQDTRLIDIPVMVDWPYRPTARITQANGFQIVNGQVFSSVDLLRPRGRDDASPGVWWCPVVILDEAVLAKNFGSVVGHIRTESSAAYRDVLTANLFLRYNGPTLSALSNAAAIAAGSPVFRSRGPVVGVAKRIVGFDVTFISDSQEATFRYGPDESIPQPGEPCFAGQSTRGIILYRSGTADVYGWRGDGFRIQAALADVQANDEVHIQLSPVSDPGNLVWATFRVSSSTVEFNAKTGRLETVIIFRERAERVAIPAAGEVRVYRPSGPPFLQFNGVVDAKVPVYQWTIQTQTESFDLPLGSYPDYKRGDVVEVGQAVMPSRARVYDQTVRPQWQWLTAADEDDWLFLTNSTEIKQRQPVERRLPVVLTPTGRGLSLARLEGAEPPLRGTRFIVDTTEYQVIGFEGNTALAEPAVAAEVRGIAEFRSVEIQAEFFEIKADPAVTEVAFPQAVGSAAIQLRDATGFSAAGRVLVEHPIRGSFHLEYRETSGNFLLGVEWPTDLNLLRRADGGTDSVIDTTWIIRADTSFVRRILNPAFEAVLRQRVRRDLGAAFGGAPRTDESAIDDYYELLRSSAIVVETDGLADPEGLRIMLEDAVPPWMSTVKQTRHLFDEVYEGVIRE